MPTSPIDSLKLKMDLKLIPNSILTKIFLRDLEQLDSVSAQANFDAANRSLVSDIQIPYARQFKLFHKWRCNQSEF